MSKNNQNKFQKNLKQTFPTYVFAIFIKLNEAVPQPTENISCLYMHWSRSVCI